MTGPSSPIVLLDLRGLKCPLPVLKTRKCLASLPQGHDLRVLTSDALAVIDIPHFCREQGHRLLSVEPTHDGHAFLIAGVPG